jgi:hypothetical protein
MTTFKGSDPAWPTACCVTAEPIVGTGCSDAQISGSSPREPPSGSGAYRIPSGSGTPAIVPPVAGGNVPRLDARNRTSCLSATAKASSSNVVPSGSLRFAGHGFNS